MKLKFRLSLLLDKQKRKAFYSEEFRDEYKNLLLKIRMYNPPKDAFLGTKLLTIEIGVGLDLKYIRYNPGTCELTLSHGSSNRNITIDDLLYVLFDGYFSHIKRKNYFKHVDSLIEKAE